MSAIEQEINGNWYDDLSLADPDAPACTLSVEERFAILEKAESEAVRRELKI